MSFILVSDLARCNLHSEVLYTDETFISHSLMSTSHDSAMLSGCRASGVMPIGWRLTGDAIHNGDAAIGRTMVYHQPLSQCYAHA